MKDSLEKMEEMASERETLQSEIVNLRQANSELLSSSEMLEKVLLQKQELENAYESVNKRFSKLKNDWENLSAENLRLKNDATRYLDIDACNQNSFFYRTMRIFHHFFAESVINLMPSRANSKRFRFSRVNEMTLEMNVQDSR
jgi:hypothetical protein